MNLSIKFKLLNARYREPKTKADEKWLVQKTNSAKTTTIYRQKEVVKLPELENVNIG